MAYSISRAASPQPLAHMQASPLPGVLGFNYRAHRYGIDSSTSYRFSSYLVRLHQLDLLLDVVESQVILALIKLASAVTSLICCLAI